MATKLATTMSILFVFIQNYALMTSASVKLRCWLRGSRLGGTTQSSTLHSFHILAPEPGFGPGTNRLHVSARF